MPLLARTIDYTDKDFDSLRSRLQSLIRSAFPRWTNFAVANFGNILIEAFAYVGDILGFYQDNQARESRWTQARQRRNLIALTKLIGFTPTGASAATANETITLAEAPLADFVLPKGTIIKTREITDALRFQTLEDITIAAGADPASAEVVVENSDSFTENFPSTSLANQTFVLTNIPFLDDSLEITDALGSDWSQVANFLDSQPTDKHFLVSVDQNDRATITFGNGVSGVIPSGDITFVYKTGGGSLGNVEAGTITRLEGSFTDTEGNSVVITATNEDGADGGTDRMTVAQIRDQAPASLRPAGRCVARTDFEDTAVQVGGVARALMLTKNEDVSIAENAGFLFIVPVGGGTPSEELLDDVEEACTTTNPKTLTFQLQVIGAIYETIDISVRVWFRQGFANATGKANVTQAVNDFFALFTDEAQKIKNEAIDFGYYYQDEDGVPDGALGWSDIVAAIEAATGVRRIDDGDNGLLLNGVNDDIVLALKEFPKLGTLTIYNAATGVQL